MKNTSLNFDVNATMQAGPVPTIQTIWAKAHFAQAAVVIVLLAAAFLTRMAWFNDPVADYDEQLYSLIGERMLHGSLPFVDLWDRKPFGLFTIFALAHLISGPDPIAYQVTATLFAFAGAWLVYSLAMPLTDRLTACGAGVIYLCMMTRFGSHSAQSEIFLMPFMLGMVALMRGCNEQNIDRRLTIAMLLGGIALQIKYTVLPQCIFAGIYAIYLNVKLGVPTSQVLIRSTRYALMGLLPTMLVFVF
ncbi:MAG: glycosyltransferase family 39 protein [Novosphingobium sp.]